MSKVNTDEEQIEKYKKELAKLDEYFRQKGSIHVEFTPKKIKNLEIMGIIPEELSLWFFKNKAEINQQKTDMKTYYNNIKNESPIVSLQPNGSIINAYENAVKSAQLLKLLAENRALLEREDEALKCQLFSSVDIENEFGASKIIMDRICHLEELIKKTKLKEIAPNEWLLYSIIPDEKSEKEIEKTRDYKGAAGPIGLEYSFSATSKQEAEKLCDFYKKEMIGKGILTYLAFSKMANVTKRFSYRVRLTQVMELTIDSKRKSYFTQKEKWEFWRTVKLLERTKLTIEFSPKGKNNKKQKTSLEKISLEPRMLNIEAKISSKNAPPKFVVVTMPNLEKLKDKAMLATPITNSTLKLKPIRLINLAAYIQTRQAQRRGKAITLDEGSLIEKSGLLETAKSNPRMATKRLKDALNELTTKGIIGGWGKNTNGGHTIVPREQKKSE